VRVIESGDGLSFGTEAGQVARLRMSAASDHLQSHDPAGLPLPGLENQGGAATTQGSKDVVSADHGRSARAVVVVGQQFGHG
jgi:hypothetical protein